MPGHFNYLLSEPRGGQSKVASERLELMAKTAAKRYLETGVSLNDLICKIASENDLNHEQIRRVCEMANINTHRHLWSKTAQKESIAFPLADANTVVKVVAKRPLDADDPESPMVSTPSAAGSDYLGPPKGLPASGPSTLSMFGADPAQVHNGMHEDGEKKRITIVIEKKAAERKRLADEVVYMGLQLETLEKHAYNAVKQAVLGGHSFPQIFKAAQSANLDVVAAEYLPQFQERLMSEAHGETRNRLEKQAIAKAPDDLISSNLGNTTVINGAHPVIVHLDTVQRKTGEIKNGLHNILRIDDEVKVYTQRLRELG